MNYCFKHNIFPEPVQDTFLAFEQKKKKKNIYEDRKFFLYLRTGPFCHKVTNWLSGQKIHQMSINY